MTDITSADPSTSFVAIGKIASAHGIKGEIKIYSYNDTSSFQDNECFFADKSSIALKIKSTKNNIITANIKNITSRSEAEALKNKEIFINLTEICEENEFYYKDLIGMKVKSADMNDIGTISNVDNYGASDLIEVTFFNKKSELYNFTNELFPEINIGQNYVILTLPKTI
ncbi:MAG: 16S rRNA processing protein RimM [Rickettsiales bacterium]|jgi:16S rRNA processing protein RimM|nr:16S rRNA processing protein RimM [Rickettsiales bacterium]